MAHAKFWFVLIFFFFVVAIFEKCKQKQNHKETESHTINWRYKVGPAIRSGLIRGV